ncbi:hypothetical protein GHT06_012988 [Daphnia sinensis]|uniref:Uncharacterized protein n=1 Tax=Daphnia sinensis TaxID=1820382 RepID=A0AAD5LQC2_9CRUS|nr:hypothetical protein GHT06_012988 [Daphnia sinensis]
MFLNPWYGQIGAGPATEDAPTTAEKEAADADVKDAAVKEEATDTQETPPTVSVNVAASVAAKPENDIDAKADVATHPPEQTEPFKNRLKCGWTAHMTQEGRLFYCNETVRARPPYLTLRLYQTAGC